jgi:hypothetical protein
LRIAFAGVAGVPLRTAIVDARRSVGLPAVHAHLFADVELEVAVRAHRQMPASSLAPQVPADDRAAADQRSGHQLCAQAQPAVGGERRRGDTEREHQQVEAAGGHLGGDQRACGKPPEGGGTPFHRRSSITPQQESCGSVYDAGFARRRGGGRE